MTPANQLAGFVALQRLLDRRGRLRRERETPPHNLAELRRRHGSRQMVMDQAGRRREELAGEQRGLQRDLEALREEQEHFRKQKTMVTNMKQLTAVVSALDNVQTQIKGKEDRLLAIWQEFETLDRELETLQGEDPEERRLREDAEDEWGRRQQELDAELNEVDRELRLVQRQLGEAAVERFKKLWASRKPHAVIPLDGTACSHCHAELRPSLVQQVRTGEDLQYCDSCRRLLYDPDQHPVSP